jgi:hypothetical protein
MRFALPLVALLALSSASFAQEAFPRRMLFVQVSDYLYLSPLAHAAPAGAARTREAAKLAAAFRVPVAKDNDQLFVLSDAPESELLPTKDVLAKTLDGFCSTTRGQDRVVIVFSAHAVEIDGKAFLVPLDGDPSAPETLLPVAGVYAKLKELKTAQKVVIWDVGRTNLERASARRDPGPMTPELFKALTSAPEGVQVLVSCSPGERALRSSTARGPTGVLAGSVYLDAIRQAATVEMMKAAPGDVIPVEAIHAATVKFVAESAKANDGKQTPSLTGSPPAQAAKFDAKEPAAKRFAWPMLPPAAPAADVKAILGDLAAPPLLDEGPAQLARLPFPEAALKDYAADVSTDEIFKNADKYPLRVATLRAMQTVRESWPLDGKNPKFPSPLSAPVTDQAKRGVGKAQEPLATGIVRLEIELESLLAVADRRDKEIRRWQANYDFAVAEVQLRLVMLNEYNRALAHVKTETLPDLPDGATGWRLVPNAKLEGRRDIQKLLADANEGFAKLAAAHKGTPWEVLARRSLTALPSVRWEPVLPPKDGK